MNPFFPYPPQQPKEEDPWTRPFSGSELFIGALTPHFAYPPLPHWDPRHEPYLHPVGPYVANVPNVLPWNVPVYQPLPLSGNGFGPSNAGNGMFPWPRWDPYGARHEGGAPLAKVVHRERRPDMSTTEDIGGTKENHTGSHPYANHREDSCQRSERDGYGQGVEATEPRERHAETRNGQRGYEILQESESSSHLHMHGSCTNLQNQDSGPLKHEIPSVVSYDRKSRSGGDGDSPSRAAGRHEEYSKRALKEEQGLPFHVRHGGESGIDRNRSSTLQTSPRYKEDSRHSLKDEDGSNGGLDADQNCPSSSQAFSRRDLTFRDSVQAEHGWDAPNFQTDRTQPSTSQVYHRQEDDYRNPRKGDYGANVPYSESRTERNCYLASQTFVQHEVEPRQSSKEEHWFNLPHRGEYLSERNRYSTYQTSSRHQDDGNLSLEGAHGSNMPHGNEYRTDRNRHSTSDTLSHHQESSVGPSIREHKSNVFHGSEYRTDREYSSYTLKGDWGSDAPYESQTDRDSHLTSHTYSRHEEDYRLKSKYEEGLPNNVRYNGESRSSRNRDSPTRKYSRREQDLRHASNYGGEFRDNRNCESGFGTCSKLDGQVLKEGWYNPFANTETRYAPPENYQKHRHELEHYPPYDVYRRALPQHDHRSFGIGSHFNENSEFAWNEVYYNTPHKPRWRSSRGRSKRNQSPFAPEYKPGKVQWNMEQRKPTEEYLAQAFLEPCGMARPQKNLCILDLNGTLIYRDRSRAEWHPRPGCASLLDFMFRNFYVMVWSSATKSNVQSMVRTVFSEDQSRRLVAVWDRSSFNLPRELYNQKTLTLKDLQLVWDGLTNSGSESPLDADHLPRGWDQSNTILIDDSFEKAALQPHNCVILKEFDRDAVLLGGDRELENVQKYLDKARWQKDVSAFMRKHPYKSSTGPDIPNFADRASVLESIFTLPSSDSPLKQRRVEV